MTDFYVKLNLKAGGKLLLAVVCLLFGAAASLRADSDIFKDLKAGESREYVIRLTNGDVITGTIEEFLNDPQEGEGIRYKTELGTGVVFAGQVAEISPKEEEYRHSHRVFLLPTAEPIGKNYFIGDFELLFLYAGFGIGDIFSLTAGRTIVPGISSTEQLSIINAKFTLFQTDFDSLVQQLSFALGGNLGFVNNKNRMVHMYGVATAHFNRTRLSASLFYKNFGSDFYRLNFGQYAQDVRYADGSFGLGLGLDSKISQRHDIHIIGELWNSDVTKPSNTAVMLGARLCNTLISMDFGLAFFTAGYVAPFTSFVVTPF